MIRKMRQIVLLSDYGNESIYIGLVKGLIHKITKNNNYIGELDEQAENFYQQIMQNQQDLFAALSGYLQRQSVNIIDNDADFDAQGLLKSYHADGKQLFLARHLTTAQKCFHLASHIGLYYFDEAIRN